MFILLQSASALAQTPPPIHPAGDAAVAGFSGTYVLGSAPLPEAQRINKTYINLDGPALRVIRLDGLGRPPQAQLVAAPKPFTVKAGQIGQVFSLALDDATPPNIYAAATSAYGLPIVVPDTDGDGVPDRARRGAPNAAFMPGLFGPVAANGGPGSIWKINGATGAVTLFANVTLNGAPNSGAALGGLTFDPGSRQLFAADRSTGMIHRFTLDGVERGRFDHGVQGVAVLGVPPIPYDAGQRIDLQNPSFDSENPATWAYAPPVRRVFALAVHGSRLYYAVASGLRIWSVSILPDGSFGSDPRIEIVIPPGAKSDAEISTIAFDGDGHMLLAERGAPTGAYDYRALALAGAGRTLRLRAKQAGENGTPFFWQLDGDYAVGFPPDFTNENGGLALGYGYDGAGNIDRGRCSATLWTTGEQLRLSPDPSLVQRLSAGGPLAVNGLQGNALTLVRPQNVPPFNSYFMSYGDQAEQPGLTGQLGGIAIWQTCARATLSPVFSPAFLAGILLTADVCPRGYVEIRNQCVPTPCKPGEDEVYRDGKCVKECPKERSHPGGCCPPGFIWDGQRCVPPRKPDRPDLSVKKELIKCTQVTCYYSIVIKNNGPGTYFGPIHLGDVASIGLPVAGQNPNCYSQILPNGARATICDVPNTALAPDASLTLDFSVQLPLSANGSVRNCAVIDPAADGNADNNYFCVTSKPLCPAGQAPVEIGGKCLCPNGTSPINGVCPPPTPKYCPDGSVPVNGKCPQPANNQKPDLSILKKRDGPCTRVPPITPFVPPDLVQCRFSIVVTNNGPGTYTGTLNLTDQLAAAAGFSVLPEGCHIPPFVGQNYVQCSLPNTTLAPGASITLHFPINLPSSKGIQNCGTLDAAIDDTPGNNTSCVTVDPFCPDQTSPVNGVCPASSPTPSGCPDGAPRNRDGSCPTPPRRCADGSLPVDGICPQQPTCVEGRSCDIPLLPVNPGGGTTPACQPPKTLQDGVCACPAGTVGPACRKQAECGEGKHMEDGECVPNRKKKKARRKPSEPSPTPSSTQAPPIQLNIGIGIGGGGGHRGGGHRPPGRMPTPMPRGPG